MVIRSAFLKNSILLLVFLFSGFAICQEKEFQEIDKLLKAAEKSSMDYKELESFKYAKKAHILSKESGDSKRIAESYYQLALSSANLELHKESLVFIQKAFTQKTTKDDIFLRTKLKELKSYDYISLGLKSEGLQELLEAHQLIKNQKDIESIKLLARIYGQIGNYYYYANNIDSAFIYYKLKYDVLKKIPERDVFKNKAYLYNYIARSFLKKNNADSSLYYIQKSFQLKQKYKYPLLFAEYTSLGDYYYAQKNYQKALDCYLKSVQNMKEQSVIRTYSPDIYKKISKMYQMLGDEAKYKEYEKIFSEKESKMLSERNKNTEYALNIILKDRKEEYDESKKKQFLWIAFGILILIFIFFFLYNILQKNLKQKENIITEVQTSLQEKDEIITKKKVETKELQQKVNDSYAEVIDLAKSYDPSFYFRFQEVYPDFQKKLLEYSPGLRTSELILCAYTFLGFTVKDIAMYTFKSVNTVRNRKQNLRKKFNIPTEQDMGIWLRKLTE